MAGMAQKAHFSPELFKFLRQLKRNNDRDWFQANKPRYIEHVRDPMLAFIADFEPRLAKVSSRLIADPRPVGGSMFRIHRDTRFSKDKSPYKTACTARFPHEKGKDIHAPGYYIHLGLDGVFFASGIWHPDTAALTKIREAIVDDVAAWKKITRAAAFKDGRLKLSGDTLKRPPRGFDPEHELIEDLKRKDLVTVTGSSEAEVCAAGFLDRFTKSCRSAAPFVEFLTHAVGLKF
jgi:uncharacterized protein (TIGR02453 family)